jgi:hypothetical protein
LFQKLKGGEKKIEKKRKEDTKKEPDCIMREAVAWS